MKSQFIARLISQPWAIHKLRGRALAAQLIAALKSERPTEDAFGDPVPQMEIMGPVAVIPIKGVIQMNVPDWAKAILGADVTDANDIEEDYERALGNPDVAFLVIDADSPGGSSLAGQKLFSVAERAAAQKPLFAFCGDGCDAASACYDAIAPARAILTGPFADGVGCVGSYLTFMDDSEFWEKQGITFEVFRSGDLKGIGEDALSEEQKTYLQKMVDNYGAQFRANVLKYRTGIDPADLEGQWFNGAEAAARGFTAGTARNLAAAITRFARMV